MDITFTVEIAGKSPIRFKTYEEAATYFNSLEDCAKIFGVYDSRRSSTIAWVSSMGQSWIRPNLPEIFKDYGITV